MKKELFNIQWHLTNKCQNKCIHCYMSNHSSSSDIPYKDLKKLIKDSVDEFHKDTKEIMINFTGGDPLLYDGIYEIISYTASLGVTVGLLGNPQSISVETSEIIKSLNIKHFQLSLDGLPNTHNYIRKNDFAYAELKRAASLLIDKGVNLHIMYTLRKENLKDLIECILLTKNDLHANKFSFTRDINDKFIINMKPIEFRNIYQDIFDKVLLNGDNILSLKENLWKLFLYEYGILNLNDYSTHKRYGCGIGYSVLSVMPDGTVLPCSHIPYVIGNIREKSLRTIFDVFSQEYDKYYENSDCIYCDLSNICRGCVAVGYTNNSKIEKKDIHCWT